MNYYQKKVNKMTKSLNKLFYPNTFYQTRKFVRDHCKKCGYYKRELNIGGSNERG